MCSVCSVCSGRPPRTWLVISVLWDCSTHAIVNMYDCKMWLFLPHLLSSVLLLRSTLYNISWCSREKEILVSENLYSLQVSMINNSYKSSQHCSAVRDMHFVHELDISRYFTKYTPHHLCTKRSDSTSTTSPTVDNSCPAQDGCK